MSDSGQPNVKLPATIAAIVALAASAVTIPVLVLGRAGGTADPADRDGVVHRHADGSVHTECITGTAQDRFRETTGDAEAIVVCSLTVAPDAAEACWWTIIERAGHVYFDAAGRRSFCDRLPDGWRRNCYSLILL